MYTSLISKYGGYMYIHVANGPKCSYCELPESVIHNVQKLTTHTLQ